MQNKNVRIFFKNDNVLGKKNYKKTDIILEFQWQADS